MLPKLLSFLAFCLVNVAACPPINASSISLTIGTDGPADAATLGYSINHFALIVNNINASMHFYGTVLGMRHVFTYQASEDYDIVYLAFSHGGKNGTGFQSGMELAAEQTNSVGLLELLYLKDSAEDLKASTEMPNTFSHVGVVVPDVKKAQRRMERFKVPILKRVGEDVQWNTAVPGAFGLGASRCKALAAAAGIARIGFSDFLMVTDPDGNLVELSPQH